MSSSHDEDFSSGEKSQLHDVTLPDEIVLRKDYSCYCTVSMTKSGNEHSNLKRLTPADEDDNAKKMKTEETEGERQAREMLSQMFDETFHSGIVALSDNYYCKVCRCMIGNNRKNFNQHKKGKSHLLALEKFKSSLLSGTMKDESPIQDPDQPFTDKYVAKTKNARRRTVYHCQLCDFRTKERDVIEMHVEDRNHLENVKFASGTYEEEHSTEFVGSGYDQQGSHDNTGYYNRAEQDIHSKQDHPFHSDHQKDSTQNTREHSSEEHVPDQEKEYSSRQELNIDQTPSLTDQQIEPTLVDNDPLLKSQVNPVPSSQHGQAPFFPHVQRSSIPFTQQTQQYPIPFMPSQPNPIPFMPSAQLATVSFPQKTSFPVLSHEPESTDQSQTSDATFDGLPGFITSESDAEIVIDVIESLVHTYLKYRLQALPGSLVKLLRKTAKGEDSVTGMNKGVANKISQYPQNLKGQSILSPKDTTLFPSASLNNDRPSVSSKKESYQTAPKTVGGMSYSPYKSSRNDSYDQCSYIEDQLKRAFAIRSVAGRQNEDTTSKKAKQIESSVVDFIKQCRASVSSEKRTELFAADLFKSCGSSSKEKSMRNTEQTEPPVTNFYRHYGYSNNGKHRRHPAEPTVSDLSKQYRKKEDKSHFTKSNESSNVDFTDHYSKISGIVDRSLPNMFPQQNQSFRKEDRSSKNFHHDTQSFLDLFKKYRGSGTYS